MQLECVNGAMLVSQLKEDCLVLGNIFAIRRLSIVSINDRRRSNQGRLHLTWQHIHQPNVVRKKLVNVKSLASKCLLELNRLSAVHAQGKRSFVTRFESCRNNQITTLIQLRALTHLSRKQKPTKNCLLGFLIRKMDNEIHLSTVCVLRVDQTFRLLEESSVDKVGSSEFRQRINGKADDFGLKDTVLV